MMLCTKNMYKTTGDYEVGTWNKRIKHCICASTNDRNCTKLGNIIEMWTQSKRMKHCTYTWAKK